MHDGGRVGGSDPARRRRRRRYPQHREWSHDERAGGRGRCGRRGCRWSDRPARRSLRLPRGSGSAASAAAPAASAAASDSTPRRLNRSVVATWRAARRPRGHPRVVSRCHRRPVAAACGRSPRCRCTTGIAATRSSRREDLVAVALVPQPASPDPRGSPSPRGRATRRESRRTVCGGPDRRLRRPLLNDVGFLLPQERQDERLPARARR